MLSRLGGLRSARAARPIGRALLQRPPVAQFAPALHAAAPPRREQSTQVATSSTNTRAIGKMGGLGFDALGQSQVRQTRARAAKIAPVNAPSFPAAAAPFSHPLPSSPQSVQGVEYVLTGLDRLVNWARKSSMWPMTFGLA